MNETKQKTMKLHLTARQAEAITDAMYVDTVCPCKTIVKARDKRGLIVEPRTLLAQNDAGALLITSLCTDCVQIMKEAILKIRGRTKERSK